MNYVIIRNINFKFVMKIGHNRAIVPKYLKKENRIIWDDEDAPYKNIKTSPVVPRILINKWYT